MSVPPLPIALAADFLDAYSVLPKQIQSKTKKMLDRFKSNPTASSLNYESIHNARDPYFKSLRVDDTYRAIVRKPEKGDIYLFLWVDHHDRAYEWAQKHICEVNPYTGALQLINLESAAITEKQVPQSDTPGYLAHISRRHFLSLGVPEPLVDVLRSLVTEAEIEQFLPQLPAEAAEAIIALCAGYPLADVLQEFHKCKQESIDTTNLAAALTKEESQQRFYLVENDEELLAILAAPLEKWRVFLHPSQRRLVTRDWTGPVRVLGGAGTGKTVVAMQRAKWLLENRFTQPHQRIFLTTFTRNLAVDIETNLSKICSPELMQRIEVRNIDDWVVNFLKKEGISSKIIYSEESKKLWQQVYAQAPVSVNFPLSFYKDEWREVIQANQIRELQDYLKVSRQGRGTPLKQWEREMIWSVFARYRLLLQENNWLEFEDAVNVAIKLLENKPPEALPFCSIIVNEAQDMSEGVFKLLRTMLPRHSLGNDLFIVGDPHQRIYGRKLVLSRCGIEIRGRAQKLRLNYCTT